MGSRPAAGDAHFGRPPPAHSQLPKKLGNLDQQDEPLDLGAPTKRKASTDEPEAPAKSYRAAAPGEGNGLPALCKVSEPSTVSLAEPSTIRTVVNSAVEDAISGNRKKDEQDASSAPGDGESKSATSSSGYVHKLKKAWINAYSGDDAASPTQTPAGSNPPTPVPSTARATPSPAPSQMSSSSSVSNSRPSRSKTGVDKASGASGPAKRSKVSSSVNGHSSSPASSVAGKKRGGSTTSSSAGGSDDEDDDGASRGSRQQKRRKRPRGRPPKDRYPKRNRPANNNSESFSESDDDYSDATSSSRRSVGGKSESGGSTAGGRKKARKHRKDAGLADRSKDVGGTANGNKQPQQPLPFQRISHSVLKKTGEEFLQDNSCFEVAPKLAKCRECRWTQSQRNKKMPNIFCRFYAFRRLRYTKSGLLASAGFCDPQTDAKEEDMRTWTADSKTAPLERLDGDLAKQLLTDLKSDFAIIMREEREALSVHMDVGEGML